jgi:hypothetical protein
VGRKTKQTHVAFCFEKEEKMKKRLMALFVVAMILTMIPSTLAFADETVAPVPDAPDYSKAECWYQIPEITKDVDTIYVYQTEYKTTNEGDPDYAPLNNPEMQEGVKNIDHKNQASVFEDATNLFIPYYRQCSFKNAVDAWKNTGDVRTALTGLPYDDITAALNYYFESCNGGRPFILAGHSQGSAILTLVLEKYFKEHPEYYDRMVAAYVIGFSVTKDELEANPHLKFAAGESDTGVIVSFDAEGSENVEQDATFSDWRGFANTRSGYTAMNFYSDAALSTLWDSSYKFERGGVDKDVPVYVGYIKGEYNLVSTYDQLVSAIKGGKNVYLINDIACGGKDLSFGTYNGEIAGNGHTVSGFNVPKTGTTINPACAIFTKLGATAKIENVSFTDATYTYTGVNQSAKSFKVAALAVSSEGGATLNNVTITGTITTNYEGELTKLNSFVYENEITTSGTCNATITVVD